MLKKFTKIRTTGGSRCSASHSLLSRFNKARDGVAAVEFALLAPLLLTLMLGSIELTHSMWGKGKLAKANNTVVNLIGMTEKLTDGDFEDLVAAAPLVLNPYPQNDLTVTVSSIMGCLEDPTDRLSDMTYYVMWSRKWLGGNAIDSAHTIDAEFTKKPETLKIADGDTLLVSEADYTYEPRIARKLGSTVQMNDISFQQPREKRPVTYEEAGQSTNTCEDFRG